MRARIERGLRAFDAANAAADAAGQTRADGGRHRTVVAASASGVEIDQLHTRKGGEALDPRFGVSAFDSQFFALHQLDDVAVLEVDGWDEHGRLAWALA